MKYFNKGSAVVVAMVIIIVLAVIGGVVWYVVSDKSENSIANWKTYKNEEYGFSITFPETWKDYVIKNRTLDWGSFGNNPSFDFGFLVQESLFNISIHTKDQWANINSEDGPKPTFIAQDDNYVFAYAKAQSVVNDQMLERMGEVSQIISTFKFIEKDETADWKTYTNEKYGYEIKYPLGHVPYLVNATSGAADSNGTKIVFLGTGEKIGSAPYLVIEYNDNKRVSYLSDSSINLIGSKIVTIDGISGTQDQFDGPYGTWITVYLNKGGIIYSLTPGKDLTDFNQILSTFKFIQ